MAHLFQRVQGVVVGSQVVRIQRHIPPGHRKVRVAQQLLQTERIAASLDIQFGVGMPEQVHRCFLHASAMVIIPHRIAKRIQGHLVAIL